MHPSSIARRSFPSRLGALLALLGLTLWGCSEDASAPRCATPVGGVEASAPSSLPPAGGAVPAPSAAALPAPPVPAPVAVMAPPPPPVAPPPPPPVEAVAKPASPVVAIAPAPASPPAPASAAAILGPLSVVEAAFGTGVEARSPVGVATAFGADVGQVWAFLRVRNTGEPSQVTMVWRREGVERFRIDLKVGRSAGWRTWSRKRVGPRDVGPWTVDVLAPDGTLLHTLGFEVRALDAPPLAEG